MVAVPSSLANGLRRLAGSSMVRPVARLCAGRGSCLMYHRVGPDQPAAPGFSPNRELTVTEEVFDEHIRYLARNHPCLTLDEALAGLRSRRLPRGSVVVTFDDGYRDNLTRALPILRRHGVPATVYVTTGFIDGSASPWWYELEWLLARYGQDRIELPGMTLELTDAGSLGRAYANLALRMKMLDPAGQQELLAALRRGVGPAFSFRGMMLDRDQLETLAADPLITIGAHTLTHPVLSRLRPAVLARELVQSRDRLAGWIGRPVRHFSYPFGGFDHAGPREFAAAEAAGYESALTTRCGHLHDFHGSAIHALPRLAVGYNDRAGQLAFKTAGVEALLRRPASRFRV